MRCLLAAMQNTELKQKFDDKILENVWEAIISVNLAKC